MSQPGCGTLYIRVCLQTFKNDNNEKLWPLPTGYKSSLVQDIWVLATIHVHVCSHFTGKIIHVPLHTY